MIATSFTTVNDLEQFEVSGGKVEQFETGPLAAPLFITSGVVFELAILHFKNKLPKKITNSVKFIFSFEVSKRLAMVGVWFLAIYVSVRAVELSSKKHRKIRN